MNHGQELSSIDFASMIGGPLNAVVEAQAKSAMTTLDFIQNLGFEKTTTPGPPEVVSYGKAKTVTFTYEKDNPDETSTDKVLTYELKVPTLAIIPIPYLRVEDVHIQFNAKISSTTYQRNATGESYGGNISAKAGWGWGSAKLSAYYSKRKSTTSGNQVNRTYSLDVKVHAVQDEIPAGLDRVLGILEDTMTEKRKLKSEDTENVGSGDTGGTVDTQN